MKSFGDFFRKIFILLFIWLRWVLWVEPRDLVPLAEIAVQIQRRHWRIVNLQSARTPRREREG